MTEAELSNIQEKIVSLRLEHADLDAAIARMTETQIYEDEQLHRLKKRKLQLKDQIVLLERRLGPPRTH